MGFVDQVDNELHKIVANKSKRKKKDQESGFVQQVDQEIAKTGHAPDDDIAPVFTPGPVLTVDSSSISDRMTTKKDEDKGLDFFQKGVFEDGYNFGDVTKAILGTAGDVGLNVVKGVGGLLEGVVDLADYGIAAGADALGYDDYADSLRKTTASSMVDKLTSGADEYLDKYSVLGRTSDSIMQGIGQVGGIMLTGGLGAGAGLSAAGVTALTSGVMGLSGMGSGMGEAYQSGANDLQALKHGLNSGAADAVSELIFGGLGKTINALGFSRGLTSADDILAKVVGSKFKNQAARNIVEFGIKSGAEGLEEVIAGVAQAYSKYNTYLKDQGVEFADVLKDENLLEQFLVGSFTSGIAQGSGLHIANKTKTDFITGQSQNEQAVIKKEIENRIAAAEKDGKKLTAQEKSAIEARVEKDLEKGYISTDTIEEVLGGESYSAYRNLMEESEEFNTLYKTEGGKLSEEQRDRLAELKEKNKANPYQTQIQTAKEKLSQDVFGIAKSDRLVESYNERARRGQAFEADLSKYDKKQQQTIQNAINSGLLNNTNRTHELVDFIAKISADKGVLFDFTNNEKIKGTQFAVEGKIVNGYVTESGVTLNVESPKYLNTTVGHEITHVLEGTEFYDTLRETIFNYAIAKDGQDAFNARLKEIESLYKGMKDTTAEAELTADLVGDYLFTDSEFINRLSTENRNVFQKIYDEIKYLCRVATAGSKEARELERVRKAFEDAYRAGGKAQNETKYSISETTDGRYAAVVDSDILSGIDTSTWDKTTKKKAQKAASEELKKFSDGFTINGIEFVGNKDSRGEYTRSNYSEALARKNPTAYLDKMRATAVLNDVIQVATEWKNDNELKHDREDYVDFVRGKTLIMSGDRPYRAVVLAGITSDGRAIFHDVEDIYPDSFELKKSEPSTAVSANESPNAILEDSDAANVAQKRNNVKRSISDSTGKQLTKGQQEYFADSKMRDDNGNLMVMYHGTQDAGFHEFDASMSDDDTSFFFVDRNDVAASYSGTTETYEAKTIRTAEDMNNFLAEIGYDQYEAIEQDGKFELLEDGDHVAYSDTAQGLYEEFCWYEGVGNGDANYKVYLNLKNPLVVDADGRNWDNVSREFSQEVADKYHSLTEEEKEALTNLAEWGEISIFRDEIRSATDGALASAYEKLGKDINMYDLFSIAEDNFSDLAIEAWAVKQMNTRDYAQKAKAEGYDGVIFKNIHDNGGYSNGSEGAATVAIAFDSNQIKSTANANPTADPDIRFSLSEDSNGKKLSAEQSEFFKDSVIRDSTGKLLPMYHGTMHGGFTVFGGRKDHWYFTNDKKYAYTFEGRKANGQLYPNTKEGIEKGYYNPQRYTVYLNVTNPFITDDVDIIEDALYWDKSLAGKLREKGYDALMLKDMSQVIVLNANQIKNVSNKKPTSNPDIRFSLSEAVEETKDLIAVHNLHSAELVETLKLSGLPSPSVAIIKAKDGHDKYGDVSLILPKDAIDPQTNKANRIYGSDAWTPTRSNAPVEYEVNYDAQRQFERTVEQLANNVANGIFSRSSILGMAGIEGSTGMNLKDIAEKISGYDAVQAAYVAENGGKVDVVYRTKVFDSYGNDALGSYIDKVGEQEVARLAAKMLTGERLTADEIATAKDSMMESWIAKKEYVLKQKPALRETRIAKFRENLSDIRVEDFVRNAWEFYEDSGATSDEIDYGATGNNLRAAANRSDVAKWVTEKLQGLLSEPAIYNGKDPFTPSGKRRSFKETHWEYTAENIVRAMNNADARGANVWNISGEAIIATATPEYKNIDEVRADKGRLFNAEKGDYEQIKGEISDELQKVTTDIVRTTEHHSDNQYDEEQIIGSVIMEAAQGTKTLSGVKQVFRKHGYRIGDAQAKSVLALFDHASKVPTGYFEAKPQRVVGFDEVGIYVIPYDSDVKLKQELLNRGYAIAEYDPKVEGDRNRVLNQFEEYKFSLSDVGEQPKRYGNLAIRGQDVAYTPLNKFKYEEDVAPVAPEAQETPVAEAPIAPVQAEEDLFPDDLAPVQDELDELYQQKAALETRMAEAIAAEDVDALTQANIAYDAVMGRIEHLEKPDAERAASLEDADVPPEMEAPFSEESENYNPFGGITHDEITRSTRSYSDRNPGARHFFEEAALGFLYDVNNSTHGERWYNDDLYYRTGGEEGFGGTSRQTTDDIAELKDTYGYTWDELRKAAEAVADGDFRTVAAKRVEYLLNKRMMEGYTDVDGRRYEPNREYISYLNETFANEQRSGSVDDLRENARMYAPAEDIAPVAAPVTETVNTDSKKGVINGQETYITTEDKLNNRRPQEGIGDAPLYDSKEKSAVHGQQTMFEPPKPNPRVATVLTEETAIAKEKTGIGGKLVAALVDKGMVFENLSLKTGNHELQSKWNYALGSNTEARAQHLMENGDAGVKSLKDIKTTVDKSGKADAFFNYLYHVHNIDRMTLDERFGVENKTVFGETVTADVSRKKAAQYEKVNPEFKVWAEDVYAYNKHLRQLLVDGGVISQNTADLWEKMYPHYVPIRRVDSKGQNISVPLDTNKTGVNNPVKKATGGSSDIQPVFSTMAQRTEQTYRAIARNSFGIELKNTLGSTINSQQNTTSVDETIDTLVAQEDHLLKAGTMSSNPTFTVFENGERVEFEITEDMFDALKPAGGILGHRNKVIGAVGNVRRNLLTTWNPVFALYRNPIKDMQDVAINSQHAVKTYLNVPNAIYEIATGGKWATEYHQNGGKSNTYFDSRTNQFKAEDNIFKKTIGMPVKAIEAAGEFIEEIPRLAEYIASRQEGRSVERSMLDAARVTTNFAAGGDFTKFLNSHGFTFLNASVQGFSQHVRNFREAGMKGFTKVLAKYVIAGLPAILLNSMMWDDDEEYEELSDYVKQNYYVVAKTKEGKFVRIPKGRTAAVMGELMKQMENLVTGNDVADFNTFFELFMNNIAPSNPVENNILAPVIQAATNTAWYGGDLVPSRLQKLPAEEQFDESTDSISKWLGENFDPFDLGPYKINYLLDQYSGGLGDMVLPMLTPEAESGDNSFMGNVMAPWKKEITTDSVLNNKNPGNFYDLQDELEVKANSRNATEEDALRSMYMDSVGWEMSDLYKKKREIQGSDLPDDEKYEAVREIQEEINALAENAVSSYEDVNIDGYYATVGDKRFDYSDYSGKWYEISGEYLEREQEAMSRYGITPSEYWNNTDLYYQADYFFKYKQDMVDVAKLVYGGKRFASYAAELGDITADKDENGKSISGSKKDKIIDYINSQDNLDYHERIIMLKMNYPADDTYNYEIINYLNSMDNLSYEDMETVLKGLGFEVDSGGNISW